jgi:DNA-directed RNA polymerase subunit RPC12/RpoP
MARRTRGYVQLEWVCPNCGTRNPGPQKSCMNCGAPQPDNVQFQRATEEKLVTDEDSLKVAQAGADYICPYCGTRNTALAKVCVQCGGDLVEAKRRASGAELQAYAGPQQITCPNCGTANPASRTNCLKCGSPLPRQSAAPAVSSSAGSGTAAPIKRSRRWIWAAIAVAVVVCAAAILLFAVPASTVSATVADVRWQTSVPVQELQSVHYSNESGNPPSGAYDVSCRTENKDVCQERVVDQGNGFGEVVQDCHTESQQYCSYTVDEWKTVQTYSLEGHDLRPQYAQPSVSSGQRAGEQDADFTVYFQTADGQKSYSPPDLSEFSQFRVGSTWTLSVNAVGAILDVKP